MPHDQPPNVPNPFPTHERPADGQDGPPMTGQEFDETMQDIGTEFRNLGSEKYAAEVERCHRWANARIEELCRREKEGLASVAGCLLACPRCGAAAELDCYDVFYADENCVFCNHCHKHVPVDDLRETNELEEERQ